jgi:predicted Zn-dependent protease
MFDKLQSIISKVEAKGASFVEARYDELLLRTIMKENERVQECKVLKRAGIGFNVYYKGGAGYAFSADLNTKELEQSALSALGIAKTSASATKIKSEIDSIKPITGVHLKPGVREPAWLIELDEKMDFLRRIEKSAKEYGDNITSLMVGYGELSGEKIFTNSEGAEVHWHPFILDMVCMVTSKTQKLQRESFVLSVKIYLLVF